jgi:hypothetical protein
MKINMNTYTPGGDTSTEGFQPLPAGTYTVKIDGLEKRTSQNKNEYYSVTLIVAEGDFSGRRIWDRLMLMNKKASIDRFFAVLMSAGITEGDVDLTNEAMMNTLLVGKHVHVDVEPEEYNGTTKAKVVLYEPTQGTFDGVGKEELDDDIPF